MAKNILLTFLAVVLAACSTRTTPTPLPADEISSPTEAQIPTDTRAPSHTPTAVRTALPEDLQEAMLEYHELLFTILVDASVLNETARQVESGELVVVSSIDQIQGLIELLTWTRRLDPRLPVYEPPEMFVDSWREAAPVHEATRDHLLRWMAGGMNARMVLEELASPIDALQANLAQVESTLIDEYGFDRELIEPGHDDVPAAVSLFLNAPTRTPTALPESVRQAAVETYMGILAVYSNAVLLDGLAQRVNAGVLPHAYVAETLRSMAMLKGDLDQGLAEIQPPAKLDGSWRQTMHAYQEVKGLMRRWVEGEIEPGIVLGVLPSQIGSLEAVLAGVEDALVNDYGVERNDVEAVREEHLAGVEEMLASASAPDEAESSLRVTSSRSTFDGSVYKIIGEVQNTSTYQPFTYVKVTANLYDANQQTINTVFSYTLLNTIPPGGGKAPFELVIDEWARVADYDFEVEGLAGDYGRADLYATNLVSSQSGNYLEIRGDVVNSGTMPANEVMVVATLYDAGGDVVGVGYAYTYPESIPAGGVSPFAIAINQVEGFADYALVVQGR